MKEKMEQIEVHSTRLLAGAIGLLAVLAIAPTGLAQQAALVQPGGTVQAAQPGVADAALKTKAADEEESASGKPGSEGIKVHGHWVLQVKNPDGTLGERREFNNSLVTSGGMMTGDQLLAALLSGNGSSGGMAIAFISGPTTTAGLDVSAFCDYPNHAGEVPVQAGISCFAIYPTGSLFVTGGTGAGELLITTNGQSGLSSVVSFSPTVNIVLSGNFTVPSGLGALGTVNAVQTYAALCMSTTASFTPGYRLAGANIAFQQADFAPKNCTNAGAVGEYGVAGALTSTNVSSAGVPAPLPVTTGQVITVTVTLSFS